MSNDLIKKKSRVRPVQVIRAPSLVPYAAERAAEENNNSVYDNSGREDAGVGLLTRIQLRL